MSLFGKKETVSGIPTLSERITALFTGGAEFETERLIFTRIGAGHTADMYEYSKDEEVSRYLAWSPHSSDKETARYIKLLQKKYDSGAFHDFGLIYKPTGKMIGTCGFTSHDNEKNCVEIGYVLARPMWGMGLATEAASFLAGYAFGELGVSKVSAKMIDGNHASMKVMKKLGMTLEGTYMNSMFVKGEYKTIHVFSVPRESFPFPFITVSEKK